MRMERRKKIESVSVFPRGKFFIVKASHNHFFVYMFNEYTVFIHTRERTNAVAFDSSIDLNSKQALICQPKC